MKKMKKRMMTYQLWMMRMKKKMKMLRVNLGLAGWISTDGSMSLGVHALDAVRRHTELDVPGELLLVCLLILLRQVPHVIGHVLPENVCSMNICVGGLGLAVISGESLLGVGDIKS